jgi:zinc protease
LGSFYTTYYVPANTIAVIVGDTTSAQVRGLAEELFAELPPGRKAGPLRAVEPPQRAERRILAPPEGSGAIAMAFHKGAVCDESYPAWDVLLPLLNARLKGELVENRGWASRVDAHFSPAMKYKGLVMILAFLKPGSELSKVESVMEAELARLAESTAPADELAAAKKASAWPSAGLSEQAIAVELGDWQAMTGDYRDMFRHRSRVEAITGDQVRSLAAETFRRDGRSVGIVPAVPVTEVTAR